METLFLIPLCHLAKIILDAEIGGKISKDTPKILCFDKYCKNELKINDFKKSVLFCNFLRNES